jgi:uncharacterized protein YegP (UPF0339 family)
MKNPKFQIRRSTNNQFYFVLIAKNGEIILTASETYTTKQACNEGIASVKVNASIDSRYEKSNATASYGFNLKAANGEILGRSERYTMAAARDNGIEDVKRDAPSSEEE